MYNLEFLAENIAINMKRINNENTASVDVLKYGLMIFINLFSIVTASALIGLLTGKLMETLLVLLAFAILRACTGGYHLRSSILCIVCSIAILAAIPHIPLNHSTTLVVTIISLLLVILFAPCGIENQTNIPKRFYPALKAISVVLLSLNLLVLNDALAVCFLVQSLMLIRVSGGDSYEKAGSI